MIELLDELTEIPFDVFWDKFQEKKPGNYNLLKAQAVWISMIEDDRIDAFEGLCKDHPIIKACPDPYWYLKRFKR